jgi:hypothetical protein
MPMVPEAEFTSYYGRPVVKAPPWGEDVPAYLFLGGLAGGSALLAAGAQFTRRPTLRRNARLGAITAIGLGSVALVRDLGRPERFLNMLRTVKVTSPMSIGSWILAAFGAGAGVTTARDELPFLFVGSAALSAGGLAMITTPIAETGPARTFAVAGAVTKVAASEVMKHRMDPTVAQTLHHGGAGKMLRASEILTVVGGLGALLAGRHRAIAVGSGLALLASSALTRFGIFEAGIHSAKDPKYTIEPQKRRLAARRAAGITDDSITTAG